MHSSGLPFKSLRRLALNVKADRQGLLQLFAAFADDQKEKLFERVNQALKDSKSVNNRRLLRTLVRELEPLLPTAVERAAKKRSDDLQQLEAHRRKMAMLHPWVLYIVGRTDVTTFVTAQTNVRWAPRKKRRP